MDPSDCCRICNCTRAEAPGSRLIRPCRCRGTLSFVHVDCLNRWRQTSVDSYYKCNVCSYQYQLRRTALADVLMSEHAAIAVTVLSILAFALLSGAILDALWDRLHAVSLATHIYRFADIDVHSYRRCSNPGLFYANYRRSHDKIQFVINYALNKLTCSVAVLSLFDKALVGSALLGCCAFARFLLSELLLVMRRRGDTGEALQKAGMLLIWVFSLGNKALSRLAMVMGMAIAAREVFQGLIVYGRALSQRIGEQILEPSSSSAGYAVQVTQQ